MLYGMDDDENDYGYSENPEQFRLVTTKKINMKKVGISIAIVIALIAIIILGVVASKNISKNKTEEVAVTEESGNTIPETDSRIVNLEIKDTTVDSQTTDSSTQIEDSPTVVTETSQGETGRKNHVELPKHDTVQIANSFVPQPNENAQSIIKDIYFSEEKQVYLTFDDGPSRDITPQILDILNQYNVKATFFVLGKNVKLYPELVKREYNEGHYLANHGYTHEYSQIYKSKDTVLEEYIRNEQEIRNALGIENFNTYLFRFPGGSSGGKHEKVKSEARALFNSYGIAYTNWNCLTGDAAGMKTKEDCINQMIQTKGNQNSLVVLMHDAADKTQTVEALPDIIQYFMNEGYAFKTFYEIF